ncbi:MAG: DEAD/DEAH box helicase [Desulfobacterales bacterium]|nr:DEAD/DEAH box helicase [Desulfobacterales bacterium]
MTEPKGRPPNKPYKGKKRPAAGKLKPGSDERLKKIFASIGVPEQKPFKPDPFQEKALEVIQYGDCLVTAPTGAGKTWIAEQAIRQTLAQQGKAWYASPLKALTNSKYNEFAGIFGDKNIGILTGDRKENVDAPITVGTTEILRNQLYDAMHRGEDLDTDFVILDEAHYLGDEDRGVVWEETMIYLPVRIPMLLLSATIGNAGRIAGWLESIRGRTCYVVEETRRPVPLYPLFLHPSGTLFPLLSGQKSKKTSQMLYKKVLKYVNNKQALRFRQFHQLPKMGEILRVLNKYRLLPAIFFLKSRADCDNALRLCPKAAVNDSPERKEKRCRRIDALIADTPHIADHKQMNELRHVGVAAHHSGQLPAWKLLIETLMTEGLLDAVFATSTVAAGVNFPARTIMFLNSDRFNGREFVPLTPTEFHQMTGRAGRRGMDNIGFAVLIPGRFMDIRLMAKLFHAPASDVYSQIKINFSMVLNLLLSHTPEEARVLLEKSFATYLLTTKGRKKKFRAIFGDDPDILWHEFLRHLDFLKEKEYVTEDDRLTEDGRWASQLRIDHPLMVAEGFRRGLFPHTDPAILAGIMASFVNERETDDESIPDAEIPKSLLKRYELVNKGLNPFSIELMRSGFEAPDLYFLPALTLYLWARGAPWEKVLEISGMAEGDQAMLILRTADNLRHIRNIGHVFPEAAETAITAIELILRDPVISTHDL